MRITSLFSLNAIALDVAASNQDEIIDKVVELQSTHNNILDKEAYKKALYAREEEGSTYVDNGITVPHAKSDVVTRPSLAALRLSSPVQYNPDDDGKTDLLFAIAAPQNGSLHVDMLARMMQMLMNEEFVEQLRTAKTPQAFLDAIDKQEEAQFGSGSFTDQSIPQDGFRVLAVTACPNGIAHTYMAAEALTKAGTKLELPVKVETNGSDGAKNILTREEIAACDGIIVAADKNVETARFDGKPVLFTRVDDGIHKPEELILKIVRGEVPIYHSKDKAAGDAPGASDSAAHTVYKHLMNGVSHMLPFVVGGGIMIALAFLLDDYTIDPSNFGMNTPIAAFFKTVGSAAFSYMLPILAGFIAIRKIKLRKPFGFKLFSVICKRNVIADNRNRCAVRDYVVKIHCKHRFVTAFKNCKSEQNIFFKFKRLNKIFACLFKIVNLYDRNVKFNAVTRLHHRTSC